MSHEFRTGTPWELLYADDLVISAETEEGFKMKLNKWKTEMEAKGLRVTEFEVDGQRGHGRPKRTWKDMINNDLRHWKLSRADPANRIEWRKKLRTNIYIYFFPMDFLF